MNTDIIKGKWHQIIGHIKEKWGAITDDDLAGIKGSSEELQGLIQKKYGHAKDKSKEQLDEFIKEHRLHDKH